MSQTDELTSIALPLVVIIKHLFGREMESLLLLPVIFFCICITRPLIFVLRQIACHLLSILHVVDIAHGKRRFFQITRQRIVGILILVVTIARHISSQRKRLTIGVAEYYMILCIMLVICRFPIESVTCDDTIFIKIILYLIRCIQRYMSLQIIEIHIILVFIIVVPPLVVDMIVCAIQYGWEIDIQ